jgi:hypothetical protein
MIACSVAVIGVAIPGPAVYLEHIIDKVLVFLEVEMNGIQTDLPG